MALRFVCGRTSLLYDQLAVLCALLAVLAVSCRLRTASSFIAIGGILFLFMDAYTSNHVIWKKQKAPMMEAMDNEPQVQEDNANAEEPPPTEEDPPASGDVVMQTSATQGSVAQKTAPPPEPSMDDDAYAKGLVVGDYSSGPMYARYARPRANPGCSPKEVAEEVRGRDRLKRLAPTSFTYGGYRSATGQTTRFTGA